MKAIEFNLNEIPQFKERLILLSKEYQHVSILDSKNYFSSSYCDYDLIAGFGAKSIISSNSFEELEIAISHRTWLFGFLSYDLKNQLENLNSFNKDQLDFPDLCFFEPEIRIEINQFLVKIEGEGCEDFKQALERIEVSFLDFEIPNIKSRISRKEYIDTVIKLKEHIQLGDIFEVNFCQEFFAENFCFDPVSMYHKLSKKSPVPFACFLKINSHYCLGSSPERFLKRRGDKIISQPIKGTRKRGKSKEDDRIQINELKESVKERSENVMIVDLVRNDLSKVANNGSVKVEELFGIYSFPQVHQMISTVTCKVDSTVSSVDVIKKCFPMGSMTGAPKVKAMELIEIYETTKRGLFSGSIGYIKPNGDFDFNVVIRSLLHNEKKLFTSFMVGGAITSGSKADEEYKESLLKAEAIFDVLYEMRVK